MRIQSGINDNLNMKGIFKMADLNNVQLTGRLTSDPELRQRDDKKFVCRFNVACNRRKKADGTSDVDFFAVVAYDVTAEIIAKHYCKGDGIVIQGVLRTRSYQDKRYPDVTHQVTYIQIMNVSPGPKKKGNEVNSISFSPPEFISNGDFVDIDDLDEENLPF